MNLIQINDAFKAGTLTLNSRAHVVNELREDLFQDRIDFLNESINKHKKEKDKSGYVEMLKAMLELDVAFGEIIPESRDVYCFNCGENFSLVLMNETTVELIDWPTTKKLSKEKNIKSYELRLIDSEIPDCCMKEMMEAGKMVSEIQVPTGELIFENYFNTEKLYDFPKEINSYDAENSINAIRGRYNLMQYLATENVGYGQMGNMSVSILKKKDGTEILIGNDYYCDDKSDYEFDGTNYDEFPDYEGFDLMGEISLSVWRWMCADKQTLIDAGEPCRPDKYEKETREWSEIHEKKSKYEDIIQVNVKPGTWVIEHYFDFERRTSKESLIYSRLFLKK